MKNPINITSDSTDNKKDNKKRRSIIRRFRISKVNIITRRGNGTDFKGLKRSDAGMIVMKNSQESNSTEPTTTKPNTATKSVSFADPVETKSELHDFVETSAINNDNEDSSFVVVMNDDSPIVDDKGETIT